MQTESTNSLTPHICKADPTAVVQLLKAIPEWPGFNHGGSKEDFWHWRYDTSRERGLVSSICCGNKAVSHVASLPTAIMVNGKVLDGAQWSDFFTDPEFRKQGLIEKALKNLEDSEVAAGIEADFSFPSPAGYVIGINSGMQEVPCRFRQYELIIDPDKFFGNSKAGRMKKLAYATVMYLKSSETSHIKGVRVEEVSEFPPDIDDFTRDFEMDYDLSLRHSREYLTHRYLHPHGGSFTVSVAKCNGKTCGYMVSRFYSAGGVKYMDIVDLCAGSHSVVRVLLSRSTELCREYGSRTIQTWLSSRDWISYDVMRFGFKALKPIAGERVMKFLLRRFDGGKIPSDPICHLMLGDSDWV